MTHPFDEIAVQETQIALRDRGLWLSELDINTALSATFKSARDRGMAETGYGHLIDYDGNFYEWKASSSEPSDKTGWFPVTIIRHKGE